jgi:hypothetical protein
MLRAVQRCEVAGRHCVLGEPIVESRHEVEPAAEWAVDDHQARCPVRMHRCPPQGHDTAQGVPDDQRVRDVQLFEDTIDVANIVLVEIPGRRFSGITVAPQIERDRGERLTE